MRKKIALISGWYTSDANAFVSEDNKFMTNCLFHSAKKYFLINHDVEFIFITNSNNFEIENVTNLKIMHTIGNNWHEICLMKILSLKSIKNKYDYIFINDGDHVYINEVTDEILESDFVLMDHYYKPIIESMYKQITNRVNLNFDISKEFWTMGNFYGGKYENMIQLLNVALENNKKNYGYNFDGAGFYARYAEELFILKYIYENNINHKRLKSCFSAEEADGVFLSQFTNNYDPNKNYSVKLLHDTKQHIETLKKFF